MKTNPFFPIFSLLFALMLATGCDRSESAEPALHDPDIPDIVTPVNGSSDDDGLHFRSCSLGECYVLVTVVSGNGHFTVCGTKSGSSTCTATNSCGTTNGYENVYTGAASSGYLCVDPGDVINVTNDDTHSALEITVESNGGTTSAISIDPTDTKGFEIATGCNPGPC